MSEQDDSTTTTGATPDSPVYAILVTNDGARVLDIDPTRGLLDQVADPVADAIPAEDLLDGMLIPPLRDIEVRLCKAWPPERIVMFSLERALDVIAGEHGLKINYPAWFAYGRGPIIGPAVIAHDSTEHGQPVKMPDYVAREILAGLNPHAERRLKTIVATDPAYARYNEGRR